MTVGQRIKWIRKYRGMTQKNLGSFLGFKAADVRIAQYESDARAPKNNVKMKISECLNVSPSVLSETICQSRKDFMHSIFWMEECKGGDDIYDCIREWERMKIKYESGEISSEEYLEWKLTY